MRNKSLLLFVLLAVTAAASVFAEAPPRIRGESATAVFHYDHPNGCTTTDAYVYVFHNKAYREGDPLENASYVEIRYYVFGQPTGEPASNPENCDKLYYFDLEGKAPLNEGDFTVAGGLKSAVLNTTIPVWEGEAGVPLNLDIYVEWTATDKPDDHARPATAIIELRNYNDQHTESPFTTTNAEIRRIR